MCIKKMLIVDIGAPKGGIEAFIHNYYPLLSKVIKIDILVFCNECAWEQEYILSGSLVFHIKSRKENPFAFKKAIEVFFKSHNEYDYVWIQSSSASNIVSHNAVKKYTNSQLITHAHVSKAETHKGLHSVFTLIMHHKNRNRLNKISDFKFGCSKNALDYLFGKNSDGIVINNGIDIKKYLLQRQNKYHNRISMGLPVDSFIIGHVGRFAPVKNHSFIIETFEEILEHNINSILILIGDGDEKSIIQNNVNMKQLTDKVIFLGERDEIEKYYSVMDAFIFPSYYEGFGISVIEAQVSGVSCYINESLPKNLDVTNNIYRLSLDMGTKEWAKRIVTNSNSKNSKVIISTKVNAYDINESINKFIDIIGI